jgi:DegV family protein with EDD domain
MTVKIVTDSVADLPKEVARELGITVVPLVLRFGAETYRDGVDLDATSFYEKLRTSRAFPATSVPPPQSYVEAYNRLAGEADAIVVVAVSARLSATHEVALQAIGEMKKKCRVEVIDSETATMAEGFIAMKMAQAANSGAAIDRVMEVAYQNIPRAGFLAAFDTLEYLRRGGRIGRAPALLGSMLKVNPLITLKDGLVEPAGRTRSRTRAIDQLYDYVASYNNIEEMAVADTACPEEAEALCERLGALFPRERIYRSKMTPVIGAHTGPGLLLVSVLGDRGQP